MIRIRTSAATVLASLLVLGTAGIAAAQSADPNTPPSQNQPSADQNRQPRSDKEQKQEQFDREKVTLKDRVQENINAADQQIDALKNMSKSDKGNDKKRDDDYQKQLSTLQDHLKKDLDKIDKASINDWTGVKPVVDRDLAAMDKHLHTVAVVTHVTVPATGAAEKQPK